MFPANHTDIHGIRRVLFCVHQRNLREKMFPANHTDIHGIRRVLSAFISGRKCPQLIVNYPFSINLPVKRLNIVTGTILRKMLTIRA